MSIDQTINEAFGTISTPLVSTIFYSVPVGGGHEIKLILVWLVMASVFFTLYFGFINIRYFSHALKLVFSKDDDHKEGQINRFQALTTSLSGTVGLGNIAGVAVAISVGGPGATLWMIIMGLLGMSTKFAEVTLGVKHRRHPDSSNKTRLAGGPMYYLEDAFTARGLPLVGKFMGIFFAICMFVGTIGAASLFQTNQVFKQIVNITGGAEASVMADKGWLFGLFMVVLVALVIIGGIKSIARVTSKIVPIMGAVYLVVGLITIGMFLPNVPAAIVTIFKSALTLKSGFGGMFGALLLGVQRAAFSNEAGFGTAAVAQAAVKTDEPITQGFVAMLGPFIDTVLICTITALVIVVTGAYEASSGIEGIQLTSRAFEMAFPWFSYVLFAVVFLFAYSTLISWSYYGVKAFSYLFGTGRVPETIFRLIFLAFIVVGGSANLASVIDFTDAAVFAMTIPNIIGLYLLAPSLKRDLKAYKDSIKAK